MSDTANKEQDNKKKRKGAYCSAVNCSKNAVANQELHFFRFPSDRVR